ncbi:MAG: hypothetical protein HGB11_00670 [Chlorobiales bacterium]|nr:hypothetical protein [Chlorobiales bacterium]
MTPLSIQTIDITPNMEPLTAFLEPEKCHNMDYNATYRLSDGTMVYAYRHDVSHAYLNISTDQRTWNYDREADAYYEIPRDEAILQVFPLQINWPQIE